MQRSHFLEVDDRELENVNMGSCKWANMLKVGSKMHLMNGGDSMGIKQTYQLQIYQRKKRA